MNLTQLVTQNLVANAHGVTLVDTTGGGGAHAQTHVNQGESRCLTFVDTEYHKPEDGCLARTRILENCNAGLREVKALPQPLPHAVPLSPDLAEVVNAWPKLPDALRQAVLALVHSLERSQS